MSAPLDTHFDQLALSKRVAAADFGQAFGADYRCAILQWILSRCPVFPVCGKVLGDLL
jgi:hypothetical protein